MTDVPLADYVSRTKKHGTFPSAVTLDLELSSLVDS